MTKVVDISKHRKFRNKAARDFDAFSAAVGNAIPDPKRINFLKMGRTDEEYRAELDRLAKYSTVEKNDE